MKHSTLGLLSLAFAFRSCSAVPQPSLSCDSHGDIDTTTTTPRFGPNSDTSNSHQAEGLGILDLVTSNSPQFGNFYVRGFGSLAHFARDSTDESSNASDLQLSYFFWTIHTIAQEFYNASFARLKREDFARVGYPDWVWRRFEEVQGDAKVHRDFWSSAIASAGAQPAVQTSLRFNQDGVNAFIDRSLALENAATSCYVGALQRVTDKGYLTVAASVLAETARHAAWINSAVKQGAAWNAHFETSITTSQCLTVLSGLLNNAPEIFTSSYMSHLPPKSQIHPPIRLGPTLVLGKESQAFFDRTVVQIDPKAHLYGIFLHGPETIFVRVVEREAPDSTDNQTGYFVQIPSSLQGACYFYLVQSGTEDITSLKADLDEHTVAGPTMMMFDREPSKGRDGPQD